MDRKTEMQRKYQEAEAANPQFLDTEAIFSITSYLRKIHPYRAGNTDSKSVINDMEVN